MKIMLPVLACFPSCIRQARQWRNQSGWQLLYLLCSMAKSISNCSGWSCQTRWTIWLIHSTNLAWIVCCYPRPCGTLKCSLNLEVLPVPKAISLSLRLKSPKLMIQHRVVFAEGACCRSSPFIDCSLSKRRIDYDIFQKFVPFALLAPKFKFCGGRRDMVTTWSRRTWFAIHICSPSKQRVEWKRESSPGNS